MDKKEYQELLELGRSARSRANISTTKRHRPTQTIGDLLNEQKQTDLAKSKGEQEDPIQMEEGVQGFGENLGRFLVGTAVEVGAFTADLIGIFDFDIHHIFADTDSENWKNIEKHASKDKVAAGLVWGWGKLNDIFKSTFQYLDNTLGDGEHEVGNMWTRKAAYMRQQNQMYNKVNTGSEWVDWALNGTQNLIGSIAGNLTPAGVARSAVKKGMSKGLATALTTAAMTQSISLNIAQGVYDDTFDHILEEGDPNFKMTKDQIYNNSKRKFLEENQDRQDGTLYGDAENYAQQQVSEYRKQFVEANPNLARKAEKAGVVGADTAIKTNTMFAFLNLGMSRVALTKDINSRTFKAGVKPKTKRAVAKAGDWIKEGSFEAIEEGFTEALAEKMGLAHGRGEDYSWSDAYNDLATWETLDASFWGFLGGAASTAGGNLMSYKDRKESADNAKKEMDKQDAIFKNAGAPTIEEMLKITQSTRKQNAIAKEAIALAEQGKKAEAQLMFDQILSEQAIQAFETGTTENLINTYKFLAKDKNLSAEARKNASKSVQDILALEKMYNETQDLELRNTKALFANKANTFNAEKQIKELDILIAAKETQLLTEIGRAKEGGHLPSLKFQQDYMDKGGDFVDTSGEVEFEIGDLDTEKEFSSEAHKQTHKKYKDAINEFQTAKQLKMLKASRQQGIQAVADNNKKYNELTSKKHQKELAIEEHLINRLKDVDDTKPFLGFTSLKMAINKSMVEDSPEKFSAVLDNYFKPYENKLPAEKLNAIKKSFLDKQKKVKNSKDNQTRGNVKALKAKDNKDRGNITTPENDDLEEFERVLNETESTLTDEISELTDLAKKAEQDGDISKRDEYRNKIDALEAKRKEQEAIGERDIKDDNPEVVNMQGLDPILDGIPFDADQGDVVGEDDTNNEITESDKDEFENADENDVVANQERQIDENTTESGIGKGKQIGDVSEIEGELGDIIEPEELDFEDKMDFDPGQMRTGLSQGKLDALTKIVKNAKRATERKLGRPISFKEFIERFIEQRGVEKAKELFSALADSWENQGSEFEIENEQQIYDDLFNSEEAIYKELEDIMEANSEPINTPEKLDEVFEENNEKEAFNSNNNSEYRDKNNQPIPPSVSMVDRERGPDNLTHTGFVTNQTDPGFAYVSRRAEQHEGLGGEGYTYTEDHLNQTSDLDNPHDLLFWNKYTPGTKLQIRVPDNYETIFVTVYSPNGKKMESLPFSKSVTKDDGTVIESWVEKYGVEEGSQEWLDKFPMMIYNSNGESVAFVRDNNWINKVKFYEDTAGDRPLAIEKNNKIRKAVFKAFDKDKNNSVSITILKKGLGVYDGSRIPKDRPRVSLREGGGMSFKKDKNGDFILDEKTKEKIPVAESQVAIWDKQNDVLRVNGEIFPMDQVVNKDLPMKVDGKPNYNYEIRVTGSTVGPNGDLIPTYTAYAVMRPPITDEASKQTIIQALRLYLLANTQSEAWRKAVMPDIMKIKQKTGIDISNFDNATQEGIKAFLGQYIRIYPIKSDIDTASGIADVVASNPGMKGKPYIAIQSGVIYIGIGGETYRVKNKQTGAWEDAYKAPTFINPKFTKTSDQFQNFIRSVKENILDPNSTFNKMLTFSEPTYDENTGEQISEGTPGMDHSIDRESENKNRKMVNLSMKDGKVVIEESGDYNNYLLDNLQTNIQSHNIGTEEDPVWQSRIQPLISYGLTSEVNKKPESNDITARNLNQASPKVAEIVNRDKKNKGEIIVSENEQKQIDEKQKIIDDANKKINDLETEKAKLEKETKVKPVVEPATTEDIEKRKQEEELLVDKTKLASVINPSADKVSNTKEGLKNILEFLNETFEDEYGFAEENVYDGKVLRLTRNGVEFTIPFGGVAIGGGKYTFDFDIKDIINAKYDAELAQETQPVVEEVEVFRTSGTFSSEVDFAQRGSGAYYSLDKPFQEVGRKGKVEKVSVSYDKSKTLDATTKEGQDEFMRIKMDAISGKSFDSIKASNDAVAKAMLDNGYESLIGFIEKDNKDAGRELVIYKETQPVVEEITNLQQLEENAVAVIKSKKGDDKYIYLKGDIDTNTLNKDDKEGRRVKGSKYNPSGKKGEGIEIVGDYYSHKTIKDATGKDEADIIIVDSLEDAQQQYDNYLAGGAKQFTSIEFNAAKTQPVVEETVEETPEVTEKKEKIDEQLNKENDTVEDARKSIDKTKTKAVTKEHPLTPEQQKENIKIQSEINKLNDEISKADAIIDASDSDVMIAMQKAVIEKNQKEIEKLQDESNVPEVEIIDEAPAAQYTEKEIDDVIKLAQEDTVFISDDGLLFDPSELTDEDAKEIVKGMLKIPGLASHHQYQLVDFMYNEIAREMNFEENTKADKDFLIAEVMKKFDEIVDKQMENFIERRKILLTAADNETAQKLVAKYDNAIRYVQNIINNKNVIAEDAVRKVFKYTGVTETKESDATFEEGNERDKIFSKTFLEDSGKDSSSYAIRRFLGGIQDRNLDGEPVTGFLNLPSYIPFDVMWNTVQNMLANSYPDFNEMMKILSENSYAKPVMDELIKKLKAADDQTKNQFVSLMAKKNIGMEFLMYSVSGKGNNQQYTLQVYNTNQTTLTNTIQNKWFNDFKMRKSGLVKNVNGQYHINSERAEEVLDEYNSFTKTPAFVSPQIKRILSNIINSNNGKNIKLGNDKDSKLIDDNLSVNETRVVETKDSKTGETTFHSVTKTRDGLIKVKAYEPSAVAKMISTKKWTQEGNDIIKDWLKNFGIELSDGTIQELVSKGMWAGEEISFGEMFITSSKTDTPYLFGNLASFLAKNIKTKDGEFSKEVNNPLSNSIFETLAKIESKYSKTVTPNAFRDGGKTIQGFTVSKFITDRAVMLSELSERGKTLRDNLKNTPFSEYSMWLNMLSRGKTRQVDENQFRKKFEVTHLGLNAVKELNRDLFGTNNITSLADADQELVKLGVFMDQKTGTVKNYWSPKGGSFNMRMARVFSPTMSDKTTMTLIKTAVLNLDPKVNFKEVENENGKNEIQADDNLVNLLYEQLLLPEINRMIDFHKKGSKTNIKGYDKGAGMFLMFPEANKLKFTIEKVNKESGSLEKVQVSLLDAIATDPNGINIELIEKQLGPEIHKLIQGYLKSELQNKLQVWKDAGFVETSEAGEAGSVVTGFKFFDKKYMEKFDSVQSMDSKVQYVALDFIINNLIANANSMMIFAGDPAMYYKSKSNDPIQQSKDTFNNIGKRLANQIAPGNVLADSQNNTYTQIFLEDIDTISSNVDFLAKLLDDKEFNRKEWDRIQKLPAFTDAEKNIKNAELDKFYKKYPKTEPYLNVEGTDAQEYTTWQEHLYVLEKLGKTPDVINQSGDEIISMEDINRARELFSSGVSLDEMSDKDKALIKLVMQPIKPVYTGQIFDHNLGIMRTVYIKSSSFPLIPQLTKGLQINALREAMEELESKSVLKDKNGIPIPGSKPTKTVRASYQSANKVGALSKPIKLFDNKNAKMYSFSEDTPEIQFLQKKAKLSKGKRKKEIENEIEKLRKESNKINLANRLEKSSLTLDRSNFRIQQDIPFKTAKRKEDYVSLGTQTTKLILGDGVTDMEGFDYNGDPNTTGKKLQEEYISNFDQLVSLKRNQLFDQLGIDINTNKPYDIKKSALKLQKILKEEAENRGYSRQVIESLTVEFVKTDNKITDAKFKIPLWISAESNRFEALLNAVVTNRLAKIKMPGNSYVAASQEGFTHMEDYTGDHSKIIYTSSWTGELKGAEFDEDGNLKKTQVFLPSKFRDNDGNMLDLFKKDSDGNYIYVIQEKEGGPFKLNEEMFDKELLSNISFRIPTSAHMSMADVEIVGFLPYESGDLMIVPRNLTVQVGLDFDIDKQTNYQLYHTIDENGKVTVTKGDIKEIQRQIKIVKEKMQERTTADIEDEIQDAKNEYKKTINDNNLKIAALKEQKGNEESIYNQLWEKELNLKTSIDLLTDEIISLNKTQSEINGINVEKQIQNEVSALSQEKKNLRDELKKTNEERIKLKNSKLIAKDVTEAYNKKAEELQKRLDAKNTLIKEKQNVVQNNKERRLFINSAEKLYEKLLKNEIIKIHSSILSNPKMQTKIGKVLSIENAKEQGNAIDKLKSPSFDTDMPNYFTPMSDEYQKATMIAGADGQVGTGAYSTDVVLHSLVRQNDAEIRLQQYLPSVKSFVSIKIRFGNIESDGVLGKDKTLGADEIEFYIEELENILSEDDDAAAILQQLESSDIDFQNIAIQIIKGKLAEARQIRKDQRKSAKEKGIELKEEDLFRSIYEDVQDNVDAKNRNRRDISEVLAERQNIAMDNAKELVMSKVNLNSETLDVDKVLVLLGFDLDENGLSIPFYFLSQPIIEDYVKLINYAKSNVSPFIADKEAYAIEKLGEKYGFDSNKKLTGERRAFQDEVMTGDKLKEEIGKYGAEKDIKSLDVEFQQAVLEKFIMLKRHGEQLRKVQKNLNVDSKGLGKSTFDTIDRMKRLEQLDENGYVKNSDKLIGDYIKIFKLKSTTEIENLIEQGYIRVDQYLIKPNTVTGIIAVNTISSANDLWSKYLPYNSEVMKNIFDEVMNLRSIDVDGEIEAKQHILQEMKKYLNSMEMGLYTFNPDEERERLFIDKEDHDSLATYLNEISKNESYDPGMTKMIDLYINRNRLIERFEYQSNRNTDVSIIKFNNSVGENFDEDAMYNALLVLLDKEIKLPDFNGKPYNTRMLAQDLMNYALLEGGIQEAIQFSKFIPIEFLNKTNYSKDMENVNLGNVDKNIFGTQSNYNKSLIPYAVSNFTRQYAQHFPNLMPKENTKNENITAVKEGKEVLTDGTEIKYVESFIKIIGEHDTPQPFISIYNASDKRKGRKKKFDLYEFDGTKYVRIPTLGVFGMSEYNPNTTKIKGSIIGANASANKPVNQVSKGVVKPTDPQAQSIPHKITEGDIYSSIESIALADYPGLSEMAKALLPFVDPNVKLVAMPFTKRKKARGAYNRKVNTIGMNTLAMKLPSVTDEDTARTLLHEYVHSITVKELEKWLDFDDNGQIKGDIKKGAPKPIENLVKLFNDTKKHFENEMSEDGKTSKLDLLKIKLSSGQTLSDQERNVVYGAHNIFEFLTLATTSPKFQEYMANTEVKQSGKTVMEKFRQIMKDLLANMGVLFEPPNIAASAIAETFKLLEIKKAEENSEFDINEATDKNNKLIEKVDKKLPKEEPKNKTKLYNEIKGKQSEVEKTKTGLQERITKKLPSIASPGAKKHVPKELVKTKIATQYIGEGSPNSSTDRYKKMYAEEGVANTGNYTSSDIVYVSSNGNRPGRFNPISIVNNQGIKTYILKGEYKNLSKAMKAGATIVMDTSAHLKKTAKYNIGELALAEFLENRGYKREGTSGIWKPTTVVKPTKITYTPKGKKEQTYTIKGNKIFNSKGKEVFSEDSVDRNKIFANLAIVQGRAKVVTHKNKKYVVNNKGVIISGVTGKIMQWGEESGDRKAILKLANIKSVEEIKQPQLEETNIIKNNDGLIVIENQLTEKESAAMVDSFKPLITQTSFKQTGGSISWGFGLQWIRVNGMSTKQAEGLVIGKQLNGKEITQEMKDQFIKTGQVPKGMPLYGYTNIDINGNVLPQIPTEIITMLAEKGIDISQYDASYNSVYDKRDGGSLIIHQDNTELNESPIITISLGRPMKFITYELNNPKDFNITDSKNTAYNILKNLINGKLQEKGIIKGPLKYGQLTPGNLMGYAQQLDAIEGGNKYSKQVLNVFKSHFKGKFTTTEYTLKNGAVLVFSENNRNVLHEIVFDETTNNEPMPDGFPTLKVNKAFKGLGHKDKFVNTNDYRVVLTLRKVKGSTVNNINQNKLINSSEKQIEEIKPTKEVKSITDPSKKRQEELDDYLNNTEHKPDNINAIIEHSGENKYDIVEAAKKVSEKSRYDFASILQSVKVRDLENKTRGEKERIKLYDEELAALKFIKPPTKFGLAPPKDIDDSMYDPGQIDPNEYLPSSKINEIDKLIENFEKTCK